MSSRKNIRDSVKTMLLNNTSVGDKVYSNRTSAFFRQELPCVSVFTTEENATPRDLKNKQYIRDVNLRIEIHAEADENLDDVLDNLSDEVEAIIQADLSLMGSSMGAQYSTGSIELAGDDSIKPVGVLTLEYSVKYIK